MDCSACVLEQSSRISAAPTRMRAFLPGLRLHWQTVRMDGKFNETLRPNGLQVSEAGCPQTPATVLGGMLKVLLLTHSANFPLDAKAKGLCGNFVLWCG